MGSKTITTKVIFIKVYNINKFHYKCNYYVHKAQVFFYLLLYKICKDLSKKCVDIVTSHFNTLKEI